MTNRLGRSKIGYTGIGVDGRPVDWYYGWNPGGFGCSGGCEGCWSRRMCKRMKCEQCQRFEVHLHEERLCQPANTKTPGVVLVNFTCDTFDGERSSGEIDEMLDAAVAAPQHIYVWLTKDESLDIIDSDFFATKANWYMGLTIRNQAEADEKLDTFLQIPGNLWLSLEPLHGPVFRRILPDAFLPDSLQGIVIGHDNRRGSPGTETLKHIRHCVAEARALGVNIFVKQIWHEGRLLRASHRKDFELFPDDLRLNTLPWSMPKESANGQD